MISCSNSWLPVTAVVKFWTWFNKGVSNGYWWPISVVINIGKLWPILNCELGSGRSENPILSPSPSLGLQDFSNLSWPARFRPWIPGSDNTDTLPVHSVWSRRKRNVRETGFGLILFWLSVLFSDISDNESVGKSLGSWVFRWQLKGDKHAFIVYKN